MPSGMLFCVGGSAPHNWHGGLPLESSPLPHYLHPSPPAWDTPVLHPATISGPYTFIFQPGAPFFQVNTQLTSHFPQVFTASSPF